MYVSNAVSVGPADVEVDLAVCDLEDERPSLLRRCAVSWIRGYGV